MELPKNNKKSLESTLDSEFNALPELTNEQIDYLHRRKIKPSLIKNELKNYMGSIALAIKSAN